MIAMPVYFAGQLLGAFTARGDGSLRYVSYPREAMDVGIKSFARRQAMYTLAVYEKDGHPILSWVDLEV